MKVQRHREVIHGKRQKREREREREKFDKHLTLKTDAKQKSTEKHVTLNTDP
jgi:2'-5' RNA ligase